MLHIHALMSYCLPACMHSCSAVLPPPPILNFNFQSRNKTEHCFSFGFLFVPTRSTSPGGSDSCQLLSRKRRRGVIEKKRRDRINSSLSELKRLVPSAYEKQGSAKLEKAEILQLTVDHLKQLHARGRFPISYPSVTFFLF